MEAPGQFAVRGGIVDIYALTEDAPWRIELWDDEVDSIRSFDPESQRSMENVSEIRDLSGGGAGSGRKRGGGQLPGLF